MRVDTTKLGLACELVRLLRIATNMWPTALVWAGHNAAWRAMVGPHQGDTLLIRVSLADGPYGDVWATVELRHLTTTPPAADGLWAYWGARFMRLDTAADSAMRDLAKRLVANPITPKALPPPPEPAPVMVRWTHARCLLCDREMTAGVWGRHYALIHAELSDAQFSTAGDGVYEFCDASGRAVAWLWAEKEAAVAEHG